MYSYEINNTRGKVAGRFSYEHNFVKQFIKDFTWNLFDIADTSQI